MYCKIGICDDSPADREYIKKLVEAWAGYAGHTVQISVFDSSESFLFHYEDEKSYDILLLDVEMEEMDGISLAKRIRKESELVQIVFITGYTDYIAEGYEVSALHYLVKPVKEEKLFQVLDRAAAKIQNNEKVLNIETSSRFVRVPLYQIRYVQVQQNYVTIYAKEHITVKRTLAELAQMLDERFFKVGRSYIVNLTMINRVTRTDIVLADGTMIALPRGAYDSVNRAIIDLDRSK